MLRFAAVLVFIKIALATIPPKLEITFIDGTNLTLTSPNPNLPVDLIQRICNTGTWILYRGENFTYGGNVIVMPDSYPCLTNDNGFLFYASARPTGSQDGVDLPTMNLYAAIDLQAEEVLIEQNLPFINFESRSFVISNGANLEFFRKENFEGESFCLVPESELVVAFYLEVYEIPFYIPDARSVKIGCSAATQRIVYKANSQL